MNAIGNGALGATKISLALVLAGVASLVALPAARAEEPSGSVDARVHAATPGELEAQREVLAPALDAAHVEPLAPRPTQVDVAATGMRSRGLFGAGLGVGAAGVALLVGGAVLAVPRTGSACSASGGSYLDCELTSGSRGFNATAKLVMIGAGGSMLAGGIVMTALGGWQVPLTPRADTVDPTKAPRPQASLAVGPTSGSFKLSF